MTREGSFGVGLADDAQFDAKVSGLHHNAQMNVEGFSIAGVETCIEVPTLKLICDLGRCSRTAVNYPVVLLSHGHLDHMGAIAQHAARRAMMNMSEGVYVVPRSVERQVQAMFNAAGDLDGQVIPRRVVPLEVGESFSLGKRRWVRAFRTFHRVPSQGYTVWEERHRLRAEFRGQSSEALATLRRSGVVIDEGTEVALLSFTGDTTVEVLEQTPELRETETLIVEATFLDDKVAVNEAREMGHIHLDELLARTELLSRHDTILTHFSARYRDDDVRRIIEARLPEAVGERVRILKNGLG